MEVSQTKYKISVHIALCAVTEVTTSEFFYQDYEFLCALFGLSGIWLIRHKWAKEKLSAYHRQRDSESSFFNGKHKRWYAGRSIGVLISYIYIIMISDKGRQIC